MKEEYISMLKRQELFSGVVREDIGHMLTCLGAYEKNYKKSEFYCFFSGGRGGGSFIFAI